METKEVRCMFLQKGWFHSKTQIREINITPCSSPGDAVMCVIKFSGERENRLWETSIDVFAKTEGDISDEII